MRRNHLVRLGLCVCVAGCYTFEPIGLAELRPEMQVRARLSPSQAREVAEIIPVEDRLIEGMVLENDTQRLLAPNASSSTDHG